MKLNRISDVNAKNTYQNTFDDDDTKVFPTRCHFANFGGTGRNRAFGKSELARGCLLTLSEVSAQDTTERLVEANYSLKEFRFLADYNKYPVLGTPLDYGRDSPGFQILDKKQTPFQKGLKSGGTTGHTSWKSNVLSFLFSSAISANNPVDCVSIILYAIKTKDKTTYGHSLRVAKYADRIASALELDTLDRKEVKLTALLHDVGKLGIDDAILMKSSILGDEEWNEMKKHSDVGENIVKMLPKLTPISHYVRFHHERYDGNGYPDKLRKRDIPFVSRIIAVADAYDAMIHNRPYRAPLSKKQALAELAKQKGKQFDPNIVRVFVTLLRCESSRKAKKGSR